MWKWRYNFFKSKCHLALRVTTPQPKYSSCWVWRSQALWLRKYDVFELSRDCRIEVSRDFLGEAPSSWVSTLPILGGHEPCECGYITFLICHRTTWSCVTWLCGWGPLILSHQPAKFGIHKPSESEDITFFICHVTAISKCHVLQRYFVDGVQSSPKSPHC